MQIITSKHGLLIAQSEGCDERVEDLECGSTSDQITSQISIAVEKANIIIIMNMNT